MKRLILNPAILLFKIEEQSKNKKPVEKNLYG